jgi:hypothetical protein
MKILALTTVGWTFLSSAALIVRDPPGDKPPTSSLIEQGRLFMDQVAPNI